MADEVGDRLGYLEIDSCSRITEYGLEHLKNCKALKTLLLKDLKHVHGKEKILKELHAALPKAEIDFH